MLEVSLAVNSTAVTANISARRLERSVNRRMEEFPPGRDRQWSKIVNADGYSGAVGQGDGECRPANGLARCFPCQTLEAAPYPPFGADFHTYPPIIAF